jgi:hypothetical protein
MRRINDAAKSRDTRVRARAANKTIAALTAAKSEGSAQLRFNILEAQLVRACPCDDQ